MWFSELVLFGCDCVYGCVDVVCCWLCVVVVVDVVVCCCVCGLVVLVQVGVVG